MTKRKNFNQEIDPYCEGTGNLNSPLSPPVNIPLEEKEGEKKENKKEEEYSSSAVSSAPPTGCF